MVRVGLCYGAKVTDASSPTPLSDTARRNVTWLISGSALTNLADGLLIVGLPWLASELTRDPLLISLVSAATRLPWLLLSIPAGVWGDRADRVRLLVGADAVRAALALWLAVLVATQSGASSGPALHGIVLLSALAFLLGAAEVVRDNTAQSLLPDLVPAHALEKLNGRLWSAEMLTGQLFAPLLAGVLLSVSLVSPFAVACVAYAVAAVLLVRTRITSAPRSSQQGWLEAALDGWRWLRQHPQLLRLAVLLGLFNFSAMALMTLLVLYSREILGLGATGYGLLLAAAALGGVCGGLVCPLIAKRLGSLTSVRVAMGLFVVMPWCLGVNQWPVLAALFLFFDTFASFLWNVVTVSWRQRQIPSEVLARVNSLYRCAGWGCMAFGALVGGSLVTLLEPALGRDAALRVPYFAAGVFNLVLMGWAHRWLRLGATAR